MRLLLLRVCGWWRGLNRRWRNWARLGLELPQRPKIIEQMENVVPKNTLSKTQPTANQAAPCDY